MPEFHCPNCDTDFEIDELLCPYCGGLLKEKELGLSGEGYECDSCKAQVLIRREK